MQHYRDCQKEPPRQSKLSTRSWILNFAFLLFTFYFSLSSGAAREIGPESDLCAEINRLVPGQELALRPGDYRGPCDIRNGGTRERPIVIRSQAPRRPARIVYAGNQFNVFDVRADFVTIRGLEIGPTQTGVDGIRIYSQAGITVEDCHFSRLGGAAVVATHSSVHGVTVRRNIVQDSFTTAIYFGCHDGLGCRASDLLVERNYIHGIEAPDSEIGYGIQVKLNSTAIIQDNVIVDTKGPGIMVYGSNDAKKASIVQRNFLSGSRTSAGIVVGGGPAIVRNNIAVANVEGGILLQDYGKRGLLRGVVITHNTVVGNGWGAIVVRDKNVEAWVSNNAAVAPAGTQAFPSSRPNLYLAGNRDCTRLQCFADPESRNYSPAAGSPLLAAGARQNPLLTPTDDFYGHPRGTPAAVGAIERPGGPITFGIKLM